MAFSRYIVMKKYICSFIALFLMVVSSCETINNKEVPNYVVHIDLGTYALWSTYGVSGVGDYRIFSRAMHTPSNFPYNANTYTGYGAVLLIMGLDATTGSYMPIAYDAACPVENTPSVLVGIDASNFHAVCPKCGSHFDVLMGGGGPISGRAFTHKYGLRTYKVHPSQYGGYTITTN